MSTALKPRWHSWGRPIPLGSSSGAASEDADFESDATSGTGPQTLKRRVLLQHEAPAGSVFEVFAAGTMSGENDQKQIRLKVGATSIDVNPATVAAAPWMLFGRLTFVAGKVQAVATLFEGIARGVNVTTAGEDNRLGPIDIVLEGECDNAADSITCSQWTITPVSRA